MLGVLIGAHISGDDERKIEDALDAKAIFYLPWNEGEATEYLTTWHPTVIGPNKLKAANDALAPEVEAALERLTGQINLNTGLGHPSDKAAAVAMIKQLKMSGHRADPKAVGRWAIRRGWSVMAANKLEAIVGR